MKTKQLCQSEEELREQLQGVPGITRVIPTKVDNQALVVSGGYFTNAMAVQVFHDLCKQSPGNMLWLQRAQQKQQSLKEEERLKQLAYSSAKSSLFAAWFGLEPMISKDLPDLQAALKLLTGSADPIPPLNCSTLDAEVGRLALEYAEPDLLPEWGLLSDSGCIRRKKLLEPNQVSLEAENHPLHLLSIILGEDREDGMNMEFVYFSAWIPAFERHVVARAAPVTDMFESSDVAISSISPSDDMLTSVKDILIKDWINLRKYLDADSKWTVSRAGMIDQATAEQIAMAAWSEEKELEPPKQSWPYKKELEPPKQSWPYSASEEELRSYLNCMTQGKKQAELREMGHKELCSIICNMI